MGQDTLRLSLASADSIFQVRNFSLIATALQVDKAKAAEVQARLYPNPVLTAEWNLYDPQNSVWLHTGTGGQKSFQLEQLIVLGGKRRSEIEQASLQTDIAELELESLTAQLRFELRRSLIIVAQKQLLLSLYQDQLNMLDSFLQAYAGQVKKGNIPLKDLIRLKGAYLSLRNESADVFAEYQEYQARLQTLLQTTAVVQFPVTDPDLLRYIRSFTLNELTRLALEFRPEMRIMDKSIELAQRYWAFQRRLRTPDLNLYINYDQRGGAFQNQINTGISLDLPVWNRNQGNIQSAAIDKKIAEMDKARTENEIIAGVTAHYSVYSRTVNEFQTARTLYNADFETTLAAMQENFLKRNISLIEFVDFLESHLEVLAELVRVRIQLVTSAEQLNLSVGKNIY